MTNQPTAEARRSNDPRNGAIALWVLIGCDVME
jgi:hypothetical protein